jgi:hypothetical protein
MDASWNLDQGNGGRAMNLALIPLTIMLLLNDTTHLSSNLMSTQKNMSNSGQPTTQKCKIIVDEYDAILMWNDVKYLRNYESDTKGLERGKKIGEVSFKVNGNVCLGYRIKNGDATWAEIGTPIYQVKGYSEKFRVFVGNVLYEANENPDAKKIEDFFDISGKVKKVTLEYTDKNDKVYSVDLSDEDTSQFAAEFLSLDHVPFKKIYKSLPPRSQEYMVIIYLHDGSSSRTLYWSKENAFVHGYGNDKIKKIIVDYVDQLAKKAQSHK